MTGVQFDEEQGYPQQVQAREKSYLVRLVLATGFVSTDGQAEYVLIGIAALSFIATLFIIFGFGGQNSTPHQTGPTEPAALQAEREASLH
jgi:hypothetical protein